MNANEALWIKAFRVIDGMGRALGLNFRCSFATPNDAKKQRSDITMRIVVVAAIDDC
ncbi:hypothetical protein [Paraburkholderia ultramafica]|uniref:hypothetical protein n=1 Tax=Paraburkholderia ultramafica TaxID=1544867 RepID=UPI0015831171|nr:hypothetical protein [Paraburkholderia ultramafica]